MNAHGKLLVLALLAVGSSFLLPTRGSAEVRAWEGSLTIPTYPWEDDVNPKFWALEGPAKLSTTVKGSITYPYTMQDHLSRTKVDRRYKALFLENEYLKVTCLPELGGRIHSVLDKTEGKEMFHLSTVIKPGMIAMRGAWISGGIEWNSGPHGHTVTIVSPVDALVGKNPGGSAFLEVSNQEKIFRTRWTVRVTLRPGKAYLEESIRIFNPTDGMHPYYFWNCTAFPNQPGTRFIYPMSLGTDHYGREFFKWPVHEGRDLSWLKNHETWGSIFSVDCSYDFFGGYEIDADRGIVQVADHHVLPGKKAWTWGTWDFGLVSQSNLTDDDGPYIEVQSGPLPTQSDYGILAPHEQVAWQEWWYPVHGLGDGFEFATKDLAFQSTRNDGKLCLRMIATGKFPGATCSLTADGGSPVRRSVDLSPSEACEVTLAEAGQTPVHVSVVTKEGTELASFTTPLPIPEVSPPDPSKFVEKPDEELSAEQKYLKGRKFDRATDRLNARKYYELALADDHGHILSQRALAVLDLEAGLYQDAMAHLKPVLDRDGDDGLAWYFLGVCQLRSEDAEQAVASGFRAAGCFGTASIGQDLAGRALMRLGEREKAAEAFGEAVRTNPDDNAAKDHLMLALYATGQKDSATKQAKAAVVRRPTDLVPRALLALHSEDAMKRFVRETRAFVGEDEFELLETAVVFADLGLFQEAATIVRAACVEAVPENERGPLAMYYLAYLVSRGGGEQKARGYLRQAAKTYRDFVFPSRAEAVDVLSYAVRTNPSDAYAHLHLGNLFGNFGRLDEATSHWEKAAELDSSLSMPLRNLGLAVSTRENDLAKAAAYYRKAITARPNDQALHRDLAEILVADGKRPEAIQTLASMQFEGQRRSDITIMLAEAYVAEERHTDAIDLLESTPYFVNWEGQDVTRVLFAEAHLARGQNRFDNGEFKAALEDFAAALTYPENLGVGRSNEPQEARAEYWIGKSLKALGRLEEARAAWEKGAAGCKGSDEQNKHRQLCKDALESLGQ